MWRRHTKTWHMLGTRAADQLQKPDVSYYGLSGQRVGTLALTFEVISATNAAPTSTGWLYALDPSSYTPLPRSLTLALQGLT